MLYFYFLRFMMPGPWQTPFLDGLRAVMLLYMLAHLPIMLAYLSYDQLDQWGSPKAHVARRTRWKDPFAAAPEA